MRYKRRESENSSWPILVVVALATGGGGYFFYTQQQDRARAQREEEGRKAITEEISKEKNNNLRRMEELKKEYEAAYRNYVEYSRKAAITERDLDMQSLHVEFVIKKREAEKEMQACYAKAIALGVLREQLDQYAKQISDTQAK